MNPEISTLLDYAKTLNREHSTEYSKFVPYNLEPGARLVKPAITPLYNRIPRVNLSTPRNSARPNTCDLAMFAHQDGGPAPYPIHFELPCGMESLVNHVDHGPGSDHGNVDALALTTAHTLRALLIQHERNLLLGARTGMLSGTDGPTGIYYMSAAGSPEMPDDNAFYGIFCQLSIKGASAVRTTVVDGDWEAALQATGKELHARGIEHATLYLHANQHTWLTVNGHEPQILESGEEPDAVEQTLFKLHVHALIPEGTMLAVPENMPKSYRDALGDIGLASNPWDVAVLMGPLQISYETGTRAADLFEIRMHSTPRIHTPGLFGLIQQQAS